jgi:hypothetical protein
MTNYHKKEALLSRATLQKQVEDVAKQSYARTMTFSNKFEIYLDSSPGA